MDLVENDVDTLYKEIEHLVGYLVENNMDMLVQKWICKHKGLIPDLNVKACQPI